MIGCIQLPFSPRRQPLSFEEPQNAARAARDSAMGQGLSLGGGQSCLCLCLQCGTLQGQQARLSHKCRILRSSWASSLQGNGECSHTQRQPPPPFLLSLLFLFLLLALLRATPHGVRNDFTKGQVCQGHLLGSTKYSEAQNSDRNGEHKL